MTTTTTAATLIAAVFCAATPAFAGVPSTLWCHQDLANGQFANQRFEATVIPDTDPALYDVHVYAEVGQASGDPGATVSSTDPATPRAVTVLIDDAFSGRLVAGDRLEVGLGYAVDYYGSSSVYVWLPGMRAPGLATGCATAE